MYTVFSTLFMKIFLCKIFHVYVSFFLTYSLNFEEVSFICVMLEYNIWIFSKYNTWVFSYKKIAESFSLFACWIVTNLLSKLHTQQLSELDDTFGEVKKVTFLNGILQFYPTLIYGWWWWWLFSGNWKLHLWSRM